MIPGPTAARPSRLAGCATRRCPPDAGYAGRVSSQARFWPSRLRWRLRGAWQWPTFFALTFLDGLIMHLLPPLRTGVDLIPGIIVASFANLFLIGAVAPWIARKLAERPGASDTPFEILSDRAGTALLLAGALGLVAAGLASRPLVVSETEATERNGQLVREYVVAHGSPEVRRNLDTANTIRLGEGFFRTCVALDDRQRAFCMFVETDRDPPLVREDPSRLPNQRFARGG